MTTSTEPVEPISAPRRAGAAPSSRLGEELPIFCERCGYSLHGLPQARCEQCQILHFHCPECGHHQPINTLRPAAQRILGRLRAAALVGVVLFKLAVIIWGLIGWFAIGVELSIERDYRARQTIVVGGQVVQQGGPSYSPMQLRLEYLVGTAILALAFGAVGRMLLLRWRRAWAVGAILALLALAATAAGAYVNYLDRTFGTVTPPWPLEGDFLLLMGWAAVVTVMGAVAVWPIWTMLVTAFLPKPTAMKLLDWQRHASGAVMTSEGHASALARE